LGVGVGNPILDLRPLVGGKIVVVDGGDRRRVAGGRQCERIPRAPVGAVEGTHLHGCGAGGLAAAHPYAIEVGGCDGDVGVRCPVGIARRPEVPAACISAVVSLHTLRSSVLLGVGVGNPILDLRPLVGGKIVVVDGGDRRR